MLRNILESDLSVPFSCEAFSPISASAVSAPIPYMAPMKFAIKPTSTQILTVAIMSNQKKKEYLKSSTTQLFTRISRVKANSENISAESKKMSACFVVNHRRKSSPNSAKIVTNAISIVTNFPSENSLTFYRVGTWSSSAIYFFSFIACINEKLYFLIIKHSPIKRN